MIKTRATKIEGLSNHVREFRKHISNERNNGRSEALKQIKHREEVEDPRSRDKEEASERKRCCRLVAEED